MSESADEPRWPAPLDAKQIQELLPHRYPMLMIDRVVAVEPLKSVTAIKCVSQNENFFQGHFPGLPIMPGVLMIEAMAQTGAIMFLVDPEYNGKMAILAGLKNIRLRRIVEPGDVLTIQVNLIGVKLRMGRAEGFITCDGKKIAEGEIAFTLIDR